MASKCRCQTQSVGCLSADAALWVMQAPEKGPEALLFRAVQDIMENSAQSLRLTRLSGQRDMSTLLAQSAFSVQSLACPHAECQTPACAGWSPLSHRMLLVSTACVFPNTCKGKVSSTGACMYRRLSSGSRHRCEAFQRGYVFTPVETL